MLVATIRPHVDTIAARLLSITGGFGRVFVHFTLTVIIASILYSKGEVAAGGVLKFARRLAISAAKKLVVILAGQAIRGVALGVIVTAIVQSLMAGLGLWVAGVPRAGPVGRGHLRAGRGAARTAPGARAGRDLALLVRECRLGSGTIRLDDHRGCTR